MKNNEGLLLWSTVKGKNKKKIKYGGTYSKDLLAIIRLVPDAKSDILQLTADPAISWGHVKHSCWLST